MRVLRTICAALLLTGCGSPADGAKSDTDLTAADTDRPTDSDVAVDTDAADTDTDTDLVDTDVGDSAADTGPHTGDPAVDTATPLADAVDGPFHGPWVTRSGTRLKVVYATLAGTSQEVFSHLHDTRLDIDCAFAVAADGRLRCVPWPAGAPDVYTAGCTRRGVVTPKTCTLTRAVWVPTPAVACGKSGGKVISLIPDPSVTTVDEVGFSSCDAVPLPDGAVFSEPARWPTPPWHFARGIARVVHTGGDVDVVVVRSADGAVHPIGLYDPARDAPCAPVSVLGDAPDEAWCVPATDVSLRSIYDWVGYSDPTCATESAVDFNECDDEALDVGLDPTGPPFYPWQLTSVRRFEAVRAMGALVPHGYAWLATSLNPADVVCSEFDFGTGTFQNSPKRALLDVLAPGAVPPLRRTSLNPGAPGVFAWVDSNGLPLLPVGLTPFADAAGVPCAPVWDASQTTVRCVSSTGAILEAEPVFADAACTEQVVVARADAAPGHTSLDSSMASDACFGGWVGGVRMDVHPLVLGERVHVAVPYQLQTFGGGLVACNPVSIGMTGAYEDPDPAFFRVSVDPRPVTDWPELGLR